MRLPLRRIRLARFQSMRPSSAAPGLPATQWSGHRVCGWPCRVICSNGARPGCWLANEAYIYVESEVENGLPPVPVNWSLYREKVAGQVAYRLYQREARGEHHAD